MELVLCKVINNSEQKRVRSAVTMFMQAMIEISVKW